MRDTVTSEYRRPNYNDLSLYPKLIYIKKEKVVLILTPTKKEFKNNYVLYIQITYNENEKKYNVKLEFISEDNVEAHICYLLTN
jgi:hypothetical protein